MSTTLTVKSPQVNAREQLETADYGNVRAKIGEMELDALAQNEVAGIVKVPPYCKVLGVTWWTDALGANTSFEIGYEKLDASAADSDAVRATAATTSAGAGYAACAPIDSGPTGLVMTLKNTGSGAATGTAGLAAHYIHQGY